MSRKVINTYQCDDLEETLAEFINKIPKEHIPYIKLGVMHFESDLYSYTNLPKDFLALDEEVLSVICSYFDDDGEVVSKSELMIDIQNSDVVFLYTPYEITCYVNEEGVDSAVSVINCLAELKERYNVDALEISVNNDSKSISNKHFTSLDF
jgi:hypothetical protein